MSKQKVNISKRDLIDRLFAIYEGRFQRKDIQFIFEDVIKVIKDELILGNEIEIRGFGSFRFKKLKERVGRNPNDPETDILIPAHRVIKFRPSKDGLLKYLNDYTELQAHELPASKKKSKKKQSWVDRIFGDLFSYEQASKRCPYFINHL